MAWNEYHRIANASSPTTSGAATTAARFDTVITNYGQRSWIATLHGINSGLRALLYQETPYTRFLAVAANGFASDAAAGVSEEQAAANTTWYAKTSGGAFITNQIIQAPDRLLDVGNASVRTAWSSNTRARATSGGGTSNFQGIFADDVNYDLATSASAYPAAYTTNAAWWTAQQGMFSAIYSAFSGASLHLVPNMAQWPLWDYAFTQGMNNILPSTSGGHMEFFGTFGTGSDSGWVHNALAVADYCINTAGKRFYATAHGTAAKAIYNLALLMMAAHPTDATLQSFGWAGTQDYQNEYWDASFDLDIGQPSGSRSVVGAMQGSPSSGSFQRQFTNGWACVNPAYNVDGSARTGNTTFALTGGTFSGSGFSGVTSISLAPGAGAILALDAGSGGGGGGGGSITIVPGPGSDDYLYEPGTELEVPGIEAVLEYGNALDYSHGRIPGRLRINDRSKPDHVHVRELTGLQDDPDAADSRTERAGFWGERAGLLFPRGRTVGITGDVRAGNVARMRDMWRRMRAQFGRVEQDLIVHPPKETPFYVNELSTESVIGWTAGITTGSFTGGWSVTGPTPFTDGTLSGASASLARISGTMPVNNLFLNWSAIPWAGEDIWVTAVVSASDAAVSVASIAVQLQFVDAGGTVVGTLSVASITSPTTGSYYTLTARVSASSGFANAVTIVPIITMPTSAASTTALYTLRVTRSSIVLLSSGESSPPGYVSAALPGFDWEGAPNSSRSYGPCYSVNQVADTAAVTTEWANASTSGATVVAAGTPVYGWPEDSRKANTWELTNPSTTSRTLAIRMPVTLSDAGGLFKVAAGRSYRAQVHVLVQKSYTTGELRIVWLDKGGSTISITSVASFDAVSVGTQDLEIGGVAIAPANAVRAYIVLTATAPTTTSGAQFNLLVAAPRFLDVSEYDPEAVVIDDTMEPEHGVTTYTPSRVGAGLSLAAHGARRRIPRPFLLRGVRSLWDGKAPESQRNLLYRRDFTMSLRATDPRIYVFDERRAQVKATGTPKRVSYGNFSSAVAAAGAYPMLTKPPPVPIGFTYEGQSFDSDVEWLGTVLDSYNPRYGPSLGPSETAPPASGYLGANSLARMYRSAEGYTYTTPEVMVTGDCISGQGFDYDLFADSLIGGAWQYNYIGALIKRVSSGTWIELRYNSANRTAMNAAHGSPVAPFSLELWCSHNASGTLTTTRLAGWDVPTSDILSGALKVVRAFIDTTGVVWCELWEHGTNFNDEGLITRQSYTLPGPLATLVGPTVAGQAGQMARLARWDDGTLTGISVDQQAINYGFPYLAAYDAIDYSAALIYLNCPVIGDADDVPWMLQLRGDIVDPSITLVGGERTATLRLSGTFPESDPVTIDFDAGKIISAAGDDYFARRLVGSRFFNLAPGQNLIIIQATSWNSSSAVHAIASWRDALR